MSANPLRCLLLRSTSLVTALVLAHLGCVSDLEAQEPTPASIEIHPSRISSFPALGRHHVVYELHLTNLGRQARQLQSLEVFSGDGALLSRREGAKLLASLREIPLGPDKPSALLAPGRRCVAFLWLVVDGAPPAAVRHRLTSSSADGAGRFSIETAPEPVQASPLIADAHVIGAGNWVALRGPSNGSGHRQAVVAADGRAAVSQRFAVDWAKLGADGRLYRGSGRGNRDWYGFGEPVLAATGGTVVAVRDGIEDHRPLSPADASRFSGLDSAPGNRVLIESDGYFVLYGHLRSGSVIVKEGERVEAGQKLGEIGNSGHSLAPHLHLQVADAGHPFAAEGLPFVLPEARLIGRLDSLQSAVQGRPWIPEETRPARTFRGEMPLENMIFAVP